MAGDPILEAAVAERAKRQQAGEWQEDGDDAISPPTVAAGAATQYGRTMTNAESAYQRALERGYDPTSLRNSAASVIEGIPLIPGTRAAGSWLRNDVGDQGRQAELDWTDAELRAVSGAAAPEPEVARKAAVFFPGAGQHLAQVEPQMRQSRKTAYGSAAIRSGGAIPRDRNYGQIYDPQPQSYWDSLPPAQRNRAMLYRGAKAASGTKGNPTVVPGQEAYDELPVGAVYIHPSGKVYRKRAGGHL